MLFRSLNCVSQSRYAATATTQSATPEEIINDFQIPADETAATETNQSITSANFLTPVGAGGQLDLDYFGSPGEVSLSTDGGVQGESYLYMTPTSTDLVGGSGGSIGLTGDVTINAATGSRAYTRGVS